MPVNTIQDLFVEELRDIYHAEKQLVKALPRMSKAASSPELKQAIDSHLDETKGQVERLEQVFELLDLGKRSKRCEAMEGLIEEARSMMEDVKAPEVLDVGLIVGGQKIEHYEIAGYGSLVALATQLGHSEAATLLQETLEEEKAADRKLNDIATGSVNAKASGGESTASVDEEEEDTAAASRAPRRRTKAA